jgi:hypothetical protein
MRYGSLIGGSTVDGRIGCDIAETRDPNSLRARSIIRLAARFDGVLRRRKPYELQNSGRQPPMPRGCLYARRFERK